MSAKRSREEGQGELQRHGPSVGVITAISIPLVPKPAASRNRVSHVKVRPWQRWDVTGACTHALVVGVSRYEHLPRNPGELSPTDPDRKVFGLGQLKTPATGALRYAEWLRDTYHMPDAPKATIRLLVSPSDFEMQNVEGFESLGSEVLPATRDNVEDAVDDWYNACRTNDDHVAILYAGGHGVELTKDEGGIVLLEDVSESIASPLRGSLDVGRVRNGMGGHPMAQRQFYFVDACRVQAADLKGFDTQGAGIGLDSPHTGAARCTPMYFSAAPTSEAFGEDLAGTIFAQALIDCMERLGVDNRLDVLGNWYCSTTRLIPALEQRVNELAAELHVEQTAVPGGTPAHAVMHVLKEPPRVPLRIRVSPDDAASFCMASLSEQNGTPLWDRRAVGPELVTEVPAGTYRVSVEINPKNPSYRDVDGWPAAAPSPMPEPVTVEVAAP